MKARQMRNYKEGLEKIFNLIEILVKFLSWNKYIKIREYILTNCVIVTLISAKLLIE